MGIYRDRDLLDRGEIPEKLIVKCIEEHRLMVDRLVMLDKYYDGRHKILGRELSSDSLPNNKLVCNHAQYITDMATGYVFGCPVSYSGTNADVINEIFTKIDEDSHNNELALDMSVYGVGYELIYMNDEEVPYPELAVLNTLNTFVVCDTTVKHKPMFAVTYSEKFDIDNVSQGFDIDVYTETLIQKYFAENLYSTVLEDKGIEEHYFNAIPVIEYANNRRFRGDYEGVITLIDAYNLLQSDRVNDKEQVVDALLAVIGASLGDDEDEKIKTGRLLKELKIIELDEGGDAKWLVKNLNETEIEVLKKSLKDDIHEFSKVPCLTDENFVGNASGIAMKYKLLGFEQLGKTKERYFKKGARQRLKLISNIESTRAKNIDPNEIDIVMKRSLPVDEELLAKIAQETEGFISWETRVKRYDEEIDVEAERKRLDEENKKKVEDQQKAFGSYNFKNVNSDVDKVDE